MHGLLVGIEQGLFVHAAFQLPEAQRGHCRRHDQRQQPAGNRADVLARHDSAHKTRSDGSHPPELAREMNESLKTLLVIAFLAVIVFNLGAGLYYLLVDRGQSRRTVRALSWRVGVSVALVALLMVGIATGLIQPHGVGG